MCKAIEDMKEDARNEGRKEGRNEERNNGMLKSLSIIKNLSTSKDVAIHELSEAYSLSSEEAMAFVNTHW